MSFSPNPTLCKKRKPPTPNTLFRSPVLFQLTYNVERNVLRHIAKLPFSCHPGKNENHCQMSACFPPPFIQCCLVYDLFALGFRPEQLSIGGGEGANFFCLQEMVIWRKNYKILTELSQHFCPGLQHGNYFATVLISTRSKIILSSINKGNWFCCGLSLSTVYFTSDIPFPKLDTPKTSRSHPLPQASSSFGPRSLTSRNSSVFLKKRIFYIFCKCMSLHTSSYQRSNC